MDKQEVKCNAKLRFDYFSVNVSVLAVVFRQQILKNLTISGKVIDAFFEKVLNLFCQGQEQACYAVFNI